MKPDNITSLIPQQPPFVMVGELLNVQPGAVTTGYLIAEENVLVEDGLFTEAGLLENMAQTAAAAAGYSAIMENRPVARGYIGAVKDLLVFALPKVHDYLRTEVTETGRVFNMLTIQGRVWHDGALLAQCEMRIFLLQDDE